MGKKDGLSWEEGGEVGKKDGLSWEEGRFKLGRRC